MKVKKFELLAATKALIGVALGYCDTLVNLLCRDINETARCFGEDCNALIRRVTEAAKFQVHPGTLR